MSCFICHPASADRWARSRTSCSTTAKSLPAPLPAPTDFSITSFNNPTISSRFHPVLTTMMIDNQEIGSHAAAALPQAIAEGHRLLTSVEIKPELKMRKSTAPMRSTIPL
ncbi:substrate-binding domain-containing protein [Rhizobium hainanense]|uniref:substrate-binding domain-containing protein n=1 Tax=Rhizobium hainanense TaxID=52131 RepID=UPI00096A4C80|nr:substrate-binding domain-containing protein [Rhizobium hainanense]